MKQLPGRTQWTWMSHRKNNIMSNVFDVIGLGGRTALTAVLACAAASVLVSNQANGALVVSALYNFTGSSLASADSDANSAAGSIAATGLTSGSGVSVGNGNPAPGFSFAGSLPTSQNTGEYISFTVTATSGHAIDLATGSGTLTMSLAVSATPTLGLNWAVRSSVDGYASNLGTGTISSTTFSTGTTSFGSLGSSYDNLSSVTFRIYAYSTAGSTRNLYADNITLNDTIVTAVPEPTNYALAGFGLMFVGVGAGRFYLARRRDASAS